LKPAFGRLPLPAIGDQAITRFVSRKLHAGLSEATVKNSLIALSGMLTDAVADGLIPANPLRRPQRARHRGGSRHEGLDLQVVRRPPKHLEIAEALALLDAVHAEQVDMVLLALTTGFRRNEILGLQWEWIDFGSSRVHLQGQLFWRRVPNERRRQAAIVRCKYDSEREVPLFSGLAARLGPRRRATGAVFVDPRTGAPWRETAPAARFLEDAYERAGLRRPGRMWHQLRHTYASVLAAGGVKRHEVEQLMGHRSQGTTGLYTHLVRETYSDVEAVLNDTYGSWVHVRQDPRRAIGPHRADWGVADDVRARRF
jgi:integrase